MRIAAAVVGVIGALCGMFFAQLLVGVSMVLSLATSQNGEVQLGSEFYLGLVALVFYAIGMAGAVVSPHRTPVGALLLLVAAVGSIVAIFAISGPGPSELTGGAVIVALFPYVGSVLLFIATGLAVVDARGAWRAAMAGADSAAPPMLATTAVPTPATTATTPVVATRAELASAVPMRLLAAPLASAPQRGEVEPGTSFDSFEQTGEFVHVRGPDFEGFLPAWSVRRI